MTEETLTQETAHSQPARKAEGRGDEATLSEYMESLLVTVILALFSFAGQ